MLAKLPHQSAEHAIESQYDDVSFDLANHLCSVDGEDGLARPGRPGDEERAGQRILEHV